MTKQPRITEYVVVEQADMKSCSEIYYLPAYYNPLSFLVMTSSKKRALARVESELGRAVRQPVVVTLDKYYNRD